MEVGQWLREQRKLRKVSLEELERQTGISRSTISRIEREELSPTWENIGRLISGLGLPYDSIFQSGLIDWFSPKKVSSFYLTLAPKLQNVGCRLDDDLAEGCIWLTTPDGVFEPTIEEIELLDRESDDFLRFLVQRLISTNLNRFRKRQPKTDSEAPKGK